MRNSEKFVTAQERAEAFDRFCNEIHHNNCSKCQIGKTSCRFEWLDLEAEEEKPPLPCPFCGGRCATNGSGKVYQVACKETCGYVSTVAETESEAIAAHNRVAKKCREGKE